MRVKICGLRSAADVSVAVAGGADALGFLCGLTHLSEDELTPDRARELIRQVPPGVTSTLVTHLGDPDAVAQLFEYVQADVLQIHAALPIAGLARLRHLLPQTTLSAALHVVASSTVDALLDAASARAPLVDAIVLDSRTADRLGGTGLTHDWRISAAIARAAPCPIVLAGGLTPANLVEALETVAPSAVDVNSGVEDERGDKSAAKCRAFVLAAHHAT